MEIKVGDVIRRRGADILWEVVVIEPNHGPNEIHLVHVDELHRWKTRREIERDYEKA